MPNCLDKLIGMCDDELDALSKKSALDDNGLARLKRWAQTLSSLETVKAMRESYPDGYPARNYGASPMRDSYGRPFGWPRMAYFGDMPDWPRDSYGAHDETTVAHLRNALAAAKTERERDAIRRAIRDIDGT